MAVTDDRPAFAAARPTTKELLLEWDRRRPRTLQREIGASDLGACERRVGYILAEYEPDNEKANLQAVLGTLIHDGAGSTFRQMQADGLIPAEDLIEFEVRFAGILGHLDRFDVATGDLIDVKTTSSRWLAHVKVHGPGLDQQWQANFYAAALAMLGYKVRRVILDIIARDTGEEYRWISLPDPQLVRDALAWLRRIRDTELEWLAREHAPTSIFCEGCPYRLTCWDGAVHNRDERSVLFREDADASRWADQLWQARQDKADAVRREDEAKGALDALRPNDTGSEVVDIGWRLPLRWTVSHRSRLDESQVRADYAAAGAEPPARSSRSVTLAFAPAIASASTEEDR